MDTSSTSKRYYTSYPYSPTQKRRVQIYPANSTRQVYKNDPIPACTLNKLYQCSSPRKWGEEQVYLKEVFGQTSKYLFITDGTLRCVNGVMCMKVRLTPYFHACHINKQYWQVRYIPVDTDFIIRINKEYPSLNRDVLNGKKFDTRSIICQTSKVDMYVNGMRYSHI